MAHYAYSTMECLIYMIESEIPEINNEKDPKQKKPDDTAGFYIRGFLKIYDPESGQIAVETSN